MIVLSPEELYRIISDTTAVAETEAFKKIIEALNKEISNGSISASVQTEGLSMARSWLEKNRKDILNLRITNI